MAFYLFNFYIASLLNSPVISGSFFVNALEFFTYTIMFSVNNESLISSFSTCMPFISSYLLRLLKVPVKCWIHVETVDILLLFPILGEKHLVMLLA